MSHEARKGAFYNYLNLFLITATGMFLTPFIVRNLGASQYGVYTLVGAMLPYLMLLDMGMSKTITRYVAHYRAHNDTESEARFLTTTIGIYGFISILLLVCGGSIYYFSDKIWSEQFTPDELQCVRQMILVVVVSYAIIIPGSAFTSICNGCGKFAFPRIVQPIRHLIKVICSVALLLLGFKALALMTLEMALSISIVVATLLYVRKHIGRKHIFASSRLDYTPILKYTGWMALYAATCAMQWNAGMIIAGMQLDASSVGVMGLGIMIGNMYGYFAETINRMTLPRATRLIKENPTGKEITQSMIEVGRIIAIVQMGVLSAFFVFGESFVEKWVGQEYSNSYIIALIMMASWLMQLSEDYGNALIEAKGRVRTMAIINFIAIFVGVIASYYATPRYGVIGLIGSLSGGTLLATIANNIYYKHLLQLNIGNYIARVYGRLTVSTIACVTAFVVIRQYAVDTTSWAWLLGGIATYVVIYTTSIYLGVLTKEEKQAIKKYVQNKRG